MRLLRLPMKGEYFDAIQAGTKLEEYRLVTPYWCKRIMGKSFDGIEMMRGYPSRSTEPRKFLQRPWRGYAIKKITHPHFGPDEVAVFAIKVN